MDHPRRLAAITSEKSCIVAGSRDPSASGDLDKTEYRRRNAQQGRTGAARLPIRYLKYETPWSDWLTLSPKEMESMASAALALLTERARAVKTSLPHPR